MNRRTLLLGALAAPFIPTPPSASVDLATGPDLTALQFMIDLELYGRAAVYTTTGLKTFTACPLPFQTKWSPR